MNTTNIVFAIISVAIIAFNFHILYKSHKELKRSREELERLQKTIEVLKILRGNANATK